MVNYQWPAINDHRSTINVKIFSSASIEIFSFLFY